jgi:peptide/nickel transport system permease protein
MDSDFILFAKARGESARQLRMRHVYRNIALPAVTIQFASFSELFGGMALAETVFSYPGIGTATTAAALNGDVPLLLGCALIGALFVFTGNLIANILYGVFDPRVKEGGDYI